MSTTTMTHHDLARRRSLLQDLKAQLADQERQFATRRAHLQVFVDRYTAALAPLYLELDALESQLHCATTLLAEALQRNGVQARLPKAPQPTALPQLPQLPAGAPFPAEPEGGWIELGPPPLKTLYRRAARRFHPDLANGEAQRQRREQQMIAVNQAYAHGDRYTIERLLLGDGEDSVKVTGGNADAIRHWITSSEIAVQGRLRVVQAHRAVLDNHPVAKLCEAILKSEELGLDPLGVMASRLRAQIAERRQEIYIGQRLHAGSELAESFLRRCVDRGTGLSAH